MRIDILNRRQHINIVDAVAVLLQCEEGERAHEIQSCVCVFFVVV